VLEFVLRGEHSARLRFLLEADRAVPVGVAAQRRGPGCLAGVIRFLGEPIWRRSINLDFTS